MKEFTCPLCGKDVIGYPALSRKDNKTQICTECGQKEAIEAFVLHIHLKDQDNGFFRKLNFTSKKEN